MTRYWDLTQQERAKLTAAEVEKFLAYELMEKGVLAVEPLVLEEVTPLDLPKRRVFVLHEASQWGSGTSSLGIGFETIEEAEAAKRAVRFIHESPWNGVPHFRAARALSITSEESPAEESVSLHKAALAEQKRREEANAKAKREHGEASDKAANATSSVWTDWHSCRAAEAKRERIRDTLAAYTLMTDGNATMARAFLAKAYPEAEIAVALGETEPAAEEAPLPVSANPF